VKGIWGTESEPGCGCPLQGQNLCMVTEFALTSVVLYE
jgi:hypothetical protein